MNPINENDFFVPDTNCDSNAKTRTPAGRQAQNPIVKVRMPTKTVEIYPAGVRVILTCLQRVKAMVGCS